jgi:hypothetical protein
VTVNSNMHASTDLARSCATRLPVTLTGAESFSFGMATGSPPSRHGIAESFSSLDSVDASKKLKALEPPDANPFARRCR